MQIAILILVFITLLGALAWHGGRDLWTQWDSPKSKLYHAMAGTLGFALLFSIEMVTSPEPPTGPVLIIAAIVMSGITRQYRLYRQQNPV
jgi:hypothetical protein